MKTCKDDANKCYADRIETKKGDARDDIHDGDLLDEEMMLVDGYFILEILYKFMRITMHSEVRKLRASTSALLWPPLWIFFIQITNEKWKI